MSCKKFGWRGHRYLKGVCECGISKAEVHLQTIRDKVLFEEKTPIIRLGVFLVFVILFVIVFTPFLITAFSSLFSVSSNIDSEETLEEREKHDDSLSGDNFTVGPSIAMFPRWIFTLLALIIGIFFILKFTRFDGGY